MNKPTKELPDSYIVEKDGKLFIRSKEIKNALECGIEDGNYWTDKHFEIITHSDIELMEVFRKKITTEIWEIL